MPARRSSSPSSSSTFRSTSSPGSCAEMASGRNRPGCRRILSGEDTMPTDLALHIHQTSLIDTHEHLGKEPDWVEEGPADVLQDLFSNYVPADFVSAGASPEAVRRLTDGSDPDLEG